MEGSVFLLFVIIAAVVITVAVIAYQQEQERKKQLADWVADRGYFFDPSADYEIDESYRDLSPLQKGSNRYGENHIRGEFAHRPFHAFDYHYQTTSSNGKQTQTHHHWSQVIFLDAGLPFKRLAIRQEHVLDGVAQFFGWDDIDFESDEFSRRFHVSSEDRKFAHDIIDQSMMEHLLAHFDRPLWLLGTSVVSIKAGRWRQEDIEKAIADLNEFVDNIPSSVVRELKEQTA